MSDDAPHSASEVAGLALEKLTSILGAERGKKVYAEVLAATGGAEIRTAEDLHAFAEVLSHRGGIEAAVGSLLSVAAVLRGAVPRAARA